MFAFPSEGGSSLFLSLCSLYSYRFGSNVSLFQNVHTAHITTRRSPIAVCLLGNDAENAAELLICNFLHFYISSFFPESQTKANVPQDALYSLT